MGSYEQNIPINGTQNIEEVMQEVDWEKDIGTKFSQEFQDMQNVIADENNKDHNDGNDVEFIEDNEIDDIEILNLEKDDDLSSPDYEMLKVNLSEKGESKNFIQFYENIDKLIT